MITDELSNNLNPNNNNNNNNRKKEDILKDMIKDN